MAETPPFHLLLIFPSPSAAMVTLPNAPNPSRTGRCVFNNNPGAAGKEQVEEEEAAAEEEEEVLLPDVEADVEHDVGENK